MRAYPPSVLGSEAEAFFDETTVWVGASPGRQLRRVVCLPDTPDLRLWLERQHQASVSKSNFRIRVMNWSVREADALSIGVFDDKYVGCAFTGARDDSFRGFGVYSDRLAKYFLDYHRQLWSAGQDLGEYLGGGR